MNAKTLLDAMYGDRVLVFGHRGASAYAPMNTLAAFELAAEEGADGIELDVHRCRDGHIVVIHDYDVEKTTDGIGRVCDMKLDALRELDAGSWFGAEFAGARIPTLREVFEAVGDRLFINIEIKSLSMDTDGIEEALAGCIAASNMQERVLVSSFNPLALIRFRAIMPEVPLGYLYAEDTTSLPADMTAALTYEAHHPHHEMIDPPYMQKLKSDGYRVNTWTVNDPSRAIELRDLGVDMLITDMPDVIRDALAR